MSEPAVEPVVPDPELEPAVEPPAAEPPAVEDGEPFDRERAMATIVKQREAEKALKARLREAEEKARLFDEAEAEKLSEQEKLAKRAAEAEAKAAEADLRLRQASLLAELSRPEHGLVDARAAAKLLEGVEYGDDGFPSNLDEILPAFVDAHPYLRGTPIPAAPTGTGVDAGAGRSAGPAPSLTADELAAAKELGMTPQRYASFKGVSTYDDYLRTRETQGAAGTRT